MLNMEDDVTINFLDDNLIRQIMCFLPLKKIPQTSLISQRWRKLWTTIPNIILNEDNDFDHDLHSFVSFTNMFLSSYDSTQRLTKLCLSVTFTPETAGYVIDKWILFAIQHQVKHLVLDLTKRRPFLLPPAMFEECSSSLQTLVLGGCVIPNNITVVCWRSLKSLTFTSSVLIPDHEAIEKILKGSPRLEYLEIEDYYNTNSSNFFNIESKNLKELVIKGGWGCNYHQVTNKNQESRISAPHLRVLRVSGALTSKRLRFQMDEPWSLVEAEINFHRLSHFWADISSRKLAYSAPVCFMDEIQDLFEKLLGVSSLTIGYWVLQGLTSAMENGVATLPNPRWKKLVVDATTYEWDQLDEIAKFMQCAVNVETLVIKMQPSTPYLDTVLGKCKPALRYFTDFCGFYNNEEELWESGEKRDFKNVGRNLKKVVINGFRISSSAKLRVDLGLIMLLLRDSPVLETMLINAPKENQYSSKESFECVAKLIQMYERASTVAQVIFF